jgi:hypothetical protein
LLVIAGLDPGFHADLPLRTDCPDQVRNNERCLGASLERHDFGLNRCRALRETARLIV